MFEEIKNIKTRKEDLKSFGYTMGIILAIVSLALFYYNNYLYQNLTIIAAVFVGLGLVLPLLLKPVYVLWMIFAVIIGWIMTRVILCIVFYIIITPISLITRLLGEDFLNLRKAEVDSYWNYRDSLEELNQKQF